jgi:hypothetical protein
MTDDIGPKFEKLFGHGLRPLTPPQVLQLLKTGPQDLLLILYWDADMPEHQLVVHQLTPDQRVVFYNPYRAEEKPVGTELADPPRRVEENGLESCSFDTFRDFFTQRKAVCYDTRES